ncbi:hypothetical protein ACO0SA_001479 [Hanseniaspora valbyensis]
MSNNNYQSIPDSSNSPSDLSTDDVDISYNYEEEYDYNYKNLFKKLFFLFTLLFVSSVTILVYVGYTLSTNTIVNYLEFPQLQTLKQIDNYQDGRLIFIGDVHGEFDNLKKLTQKIDNKFVITDDDKFILLGDFTTKGLHSDKVVDWMKDHDSQVECVFGNHEITALFYQVNQHKDLLDSFNKYIKLTQRYFRKHGFEMPAKQKEKLLRLETHGYIPLDFTDNRNDFIPDTNSIMKAHKQVIEQLGDKRIKYISNKCSAVLQFPQLKLVSAHAGILPSDLEPIVVSERNNPLETPRVSHLSIKSLISMKWVDKDDFTKTNKLKFDNAIQWFKLWKNDHLTQIISDKLIRKIISSYQVIYGHNAKRGLNIHKRTNGLDSTCVAGGELSAMIYTVKSGQITEQELVSVDCN